MSLLLIRNKARDDYTTNRLFDYIELESNVQIYYVVNENNISLFAHNVLLNPPENLPALYLAQFSRLPLLLELANPLSE